MVAAREPQVSWTALHRLGRVNGDPGRAARFGMATLLLATFATLLYVATRRWDIVLFGALLFALGAFWAAHHYPYVNSRIAVWCNPFSDPHGAGYQSSQAYYSLAAGGLLGTGYGLGHPNFIPDVATDYVYAAFAEEFGVVGAIVVLAIFLDLVRRIFAAGLEQPDLYSKLLATGLGATLGFQVVIIVGGVIGLLPLTGITLPFISYGGSSLLANFLLVALVWAISARPREDCMRFFAAAALVLALAACAKGSNNASTAAAASASAAAEAENPASASDGATVYLGNLLELSPDQRGGRLRRVSAPGGQSRRDRQSGHGHRDREKRARGEDRRARQRLQRHYAAWKKQISDQRSPK